MANNVGQGDYIVKQGDCLSSIAAEHGFFWESLWDLPENGELKSVRKDPYILLPGDRVFIPPLRPKEETRPTDQVHTFKVKGVPERLHLIITDEEDQPLANRPYTLDIDDKQRLEGETDGSGAIETFIMPNARSGHLIVGQGDEMREYHLGLGHIDPIEEISGVQGRLFNLGFYDGPVDGKLSGHTSMAVLRFQERYNLEATGKTDDQTRNKLKEIFGC